MNDAKPKPDPPQGRYSLHYDAECPMCAWYSGAFVEAGLLEEDNRVEMSSTTLKYPGIDSIKARHEIPLVDEQTGEVHYGIDALCTLLENYHPYLRVIIRALKLRTVFKPLYHFISFNRRILSGSAVDAGMAPDFHAGYRGAWIVLATLIAMLVSGWGGMVFMPQIMHVSPMQGAINALIIVGPGWLLTGFMITNHYQVRKRWDALGNLATVMCTGVLVWIPAIVFWNESSGYFIPLLFTALSFLTMLKMWMRRTSALNMPTIWVWIWLLSLWSTAGIAFTLLNL